MVPFNADSANESDSFGGTPSSDKVYQTLNHVSSLRLASAGD